MQKKNKVIVLFSGGLDSLLVIKILQEQGLEIEAIQFKLPFGCKSCKDEKEKGDFIRKERIKLIKFDCTKGLLFEEYLELIKKPKYGFGTGINPCVDCKIFMFKKAKEYADKEGIRIIATGEVLGERPMSQTSKALELIDRKVGFEILRPLSAKLLKETSAEKNKLVNRNKFFDINGRTRKKQIELAKKYNLNFPSPSGGCLLCEKILARRLKLLIEKNLINEKTFELSKIGRHFVINGCWFIVGRKEKENFVIETFSSSLKSAKERPAVCYIGQENEENKNVLKELQEAYSTGSIKEREKFEQFRI